MVQPLKSDILFDELDSLSKEVICAQHQEDEAEEITREICNMNLMVVRHRSADEDILHNRLENARIRSCSIALNGQERKSSELLNSKKKWIQQLSKIGKKKEQKERPPGNKYLNGIFLKPTCLLPTNSPYLTNMSVVRLFLTTLKSSFFVSLVIFHVLKPLFISQLRSPSISFHPVFEKSSQSRR